MSGPGQPPDDVAAFFAGIAAEHPRCLWLDGGGGREWSGTRSIIGWLAPQDVSLTYRAATGEVTRHADGRAEVVGDDVFEVLQAELDAGGPTDRWFGYLGYASRPDLPAAVSTDHAAMPDAVWMRPSGLRLVEHPLVADPATRAGSGRARTDPAVPPAYAAAYADVQEHLHAGDSYEVNLTYRRAVASDLDPVAAYLRLRAANPAPYAGFLQHDVAAPGARAWLLSSSPERYALIGPRGGTGSGTGSGTGRWIETKPIKGTTERSGDPATDAAHRERLVTDPAYRAENLMIVDLLRNDLSTVCEVGSVQVPVLMAVESYPSVHQLVSTVRGRLRADVSTLQALRALFPAGSMTGAPKLRTMQIIERVEETPRGAYAGAFGWLDAAGRADLGVVIRSLTTTGDGRWQVGTGGGVTVASTLAAEHAETLLKVDRLLQVLAPPG